MNTKIYEGMFLVDTALASANWDGIVNAVKTILEKAKAEIVSLNKWDERKLAYDINGVSRGTYILVYFKVDGSKIQEIEKSVQLSEQIMRVLILNAEGQTSEDMEKETPAARFERERQKAETESKDTEKNVSEVDSDSDDEDYEDDEDDDENKYDDDGDGQDDDSDQDEDEDISSDDEK